MGEIHAYMGIGLSTHNIQNAQRVASAALGLNTSSEALYMLHAENQLQKRLYLVLVALSLGVEQKQVMLKVLRLLRNVL